MLGAWGENSLFFEPIGRKPGAVKVEAQNKDAAPVLAFSLRIEAEGPTHAPTLVRLHAEEIVPGSSLDDLIVQAIASLPKVDASEVIEGAPGIPIEAIAAAVKKAVRTLRRPLRRLEHDQRIVATGKMAKPKLLYGIKD